MAKSYEKWVESIITQLSGVLNLHEWRIGIEFDVEDEMEGCVGFANIDSRYLTAYIHFTPFARELWKDNRMVVLQEAIVHEVCHLLLNPLHGFAKQAASPQTESQLTDILEQTTQRLTRIVIENLPKKFFQI
jgi:hypothetical protein